MKILLVEDDPDIAEFIKIGLESLSFSVDATNNGEQGSYLARTNHYDLIVLDYSLPLKNGLEVCKEIRRAGRTVPIIFLSVLGDTKRKIDALTHGADDYMTKPFHFEELSARIKALLRRPPKILDAIITAGELMVDTDKRLVFRSQKPIYLTRKEYSLLEYLVRNRDTAVSRSMIMEHVWSADSDPFSNTVETHLVNLRKKVNAGFDHDIIKNIPGRGYIIDA